jgi:predicted transcriptional regulator
MAVKQHPIKSPGPARRKATTFRLDPELQENLSLLSEVLKKPINRLVNEAVKGYLEKRSAEVESDLQRVLDRVKASRRNDPKFEYAIDAAVEAEALFAAEDPAEGHAHPKAGPSQVAVHKLIRR